MKIIISGYGRMGKEIEIIAKDRKHEIMAIFDKPEDWKKQAEIMQKANVIIDFSQPQSAAKNIMHAFKHNTPIVSGTTGWHDSKDDIVNYCINNNQSLFFAPNFSLSVNIYFEINKILSKLMNNLNNYDIVIEETHHINKIDTPSGTAVQLAEDIIKNGAYKEKWVNFASAKKEELSIVSHRKTSAIGTHKVVYSSKNELIKIEHRAKNRKNFALGAVLAAEWLIGKKGYFEMKDMLNF